MGSGRASIVYKLHAVIHSLRLQTNSWRQAVCLVNSVLSWTGDLGTEQHVVDFKWRLADLVGDWVLGPSEFDFAVEDGGAPPGSEVESEFGFEQEVGGAEPVRHEAAQSANTSDLIVDGTKSIFIAGMLHVVHGCVKDFSKVLRCYTAWVDDLAQALGRANDPRVSRAPTPHAFGFGVQFLGQADGFICVSPLCV